MGQSLEGPNNFRLIQNSSCGEKLLCLDSGKSENFSRSIAEYNKKKKKKNPLIPKQTSNGFTRFVGLLVR